MPQYQYRPLRHINSIRLLVLHRAPLVSDPIICTLHHARLLDNTLEYEALSYTWGDPARTKKISFQTGEELTIGENCYAALRRLRYSNDDRLLWIDAICINQADLDERANQVRMMHSIYSLGSEVIVYLGEQVTECHDLFAAYEDADEKCRWLDNYRVPVTDAVMEQALELYKLPWFKRVWILQEACAKPLEYVTFIYGEHVASARAVLEMHSSSTEWETFVTSDLPVPLNWMVNGPQKYRSPYIGLWQRLKGSYMSLASDPKDKAFALISLVGPEEPELRALIDYNQSVEECFTKVMTALLPVLGLRLLHALRHPHERDMSSWVPDWTLRLPIRRDADTEILPVHEAHYELQSASDGCDPKSLKLLVKGFRFAKVIRLSHQLWFYDDVDAVMQISHLYQALTAWCDKIYAEHTREDGAPKSMFGHMALDVISSLKDGYPDCFLNHVECNQLHTGLYDDMIAYLHVREWIAALNYCHIALLDNGMLVVVPTGTGIHDVVTMLQGCPSACILRFIEDNHCTLISGDCMPFPIYFIPNEEIGAFAVENYIAENLERLESICIH